MTGAYVTFTIEPFLPTYFDKSQGGAYPNYAIESTPLSELYGENVNRLKILRQAWDRQNVTYLSGGFKF